MKELEQTVKQGINQILVEIFKEWQEAEREDRWPSAPAIQGKILPIQKEIDDAFILARERLGKHKKFNFFGGE